MPSKIDEISYTLGGLKQVTDSLVETTESLRDTFRIHCKDDDNRHMENIAALRSIEANMAKIASRSVAIPAPGIVISRGTLALFAAFATGVLTLLVSGAQLAAGRALDWLVTKIH